MTAKHILLLVCTFVLLLGGTLRIIGMTWGLPYQLEPDEPSIFINAWERATVGTPSMAREYPPLYPIFLSRERQLIDLLGGKDTPQVIYFFWGRITSVMISLLTLAMAYRTGKTAASPYAGIAFMLFFAVETDVALEMGWIIKSDNPAWLLTLCTLWASLITLQKRSWAWLGVALIFGLLATFAKYNMALVFIAVLYALWYLLVGGRPRFMWLIPVIVLVSIFTVRLLIRTYWLSDIAPYFANCNVAVDLSNPQTIDEPPFCSAFFTLQKYATPFYQRDNFLNENNRATFTYLAHEIAGILGWWRLFLGALLAGGWVYLARQENKQAVGMFTALSGGGLLLFTMLEVQHPIRQYYVIILGIGLLLALFIGQIGQKSPRLYTVLLFIFFIPYLIPALERRIDLTQTDTREATAEYMLDNAPPGAAILVEYDKVEFMSQFGGFQGYDNLFNVIGLQSIYEKDVDTLAEQGIAYIVVDARSENRGGYYANPQAFPEEKYDLVLNLESDNYVGPKRKIYRTFRPQVETNFHFGSLARLMGYDQTLDNDTLSLRLYWQSLADAPPDYSVFVHLVNAETGEVVVRKDAAPEPATLWWSKQEWIFETRQIPLDDLPAGSYFVRMGMYDPLSGQRLPVNGTDFIELTPFTHD